MILAGDDATGISSSTSQTEGLHDSFDYHIAQQLATYLKDITVTGVTSQGSGLIRGLGSSRKCVIVFSAIEFLAQVHKV